MFLSNIETCEDMDEKCTWGIPDCRNSKVVEKCPKTCDACNGKCYATFVENTNFLYLIRFVIISNGVF